MATIAEKLINQGKWDVVMNMLREGASIDFIAKVTGLKKEEVVALQKEKE